MEVKELSFAYKKEPDIARTCSFVLQLDDKSDATLHDLSSEVLQNLSKKYFA